MARPDLLFSVFTVFYAISWGFIANVQPRWKPFQLPLWEITQVRKRVWLSFKWFNAFPLLYFCWVTFVLNTLSPNIEFSESFLFYKDFWSALGINVLQVLNILFSSIFPTFAVFGFYRRWLATIEKNPSTYYFCECGFKEYKNNSFYEKYRPVEPVYRNTENYEQPLGPPFDKYIKNELINVDLPYVDLAGDGEGNKAWGNGYIIFGFVTPFFPIVIELIYTKYFAPI